MNMDSEKRDDPDKILYKEESFAIQGAIYEVYREIGSGFLEAVYQECLEREFTFRGIPFESQAQLCLKYKGEPLKQTYKPDFLCYDKIVVELKAVKEIIPDHKAQVLNCLRITRFNLGIIANFGSYPKATIFRMVR